MLTYVQRFETYLSTANLMRNPVSLFEPIEYLIQLGGKRFRPALCMFGYHLFKEDFERVLPQALALELFHNFTLIHDDIMDKAPLRRGASTVHTKWSLNTAILSGDAAMILAYEYLVKDVDGPKALQLIQIFNRMALDVCAGQQLDMNFEQEEVVNVTDYIQMIKGKTSVLLGAAIGMGALCAGAPQAAIEGVTQFGLNVGLAFQIQDDILDLYGGATVGKQAGGDVIQSKKTILYAVALDHLRNVERRQFIEVYNQSNDPDQKLIAVREWFDRYEIRKKAEAIQLKYYNEAIKSVEDLNLSEENHLKIQHLGQLLFKRSM
jgi:geranylgeranyl diphosphate synthase type II